jgi:hypothetical protein
LYAERAGHAIHTALVDQIGRLKDHHQICTALDMEPALDLECGGTFAAEPVSIQYPIS